MLGEALAAQGTDALPDDEADGMFSGRKPGERFLLAAQMLGMLLIIGLMVLAIGNDIARII